MKKKRIIMHIDMDAFFASIEIRENPKLKGKAVVVGADPKEGKGRGVVSTASYKAREFGVYSGQPISLAWKNCPHCIFLRPNFPLYQKVSQNIFKILKKYSKRIEKASIDEAYLDVSFLGDFKKAKKMAEKIKKEIKEKEKLTASIGIGPNKLIAKIASSYRKPDGLTVVEEKKVKEFLFPLPIEKLPGVGEKTAKILKYYGIRKIRNIVQIGKKFMKEILGKRGEELFYLAQGIDNSPVLTKRKAKSIGKEITFEKDESRKEIIYKTLKSLCQEVFKACQKRNFKFKTIMVKIRYQNYETHTKQETLPSLPLTFLDFFHIAKRLLSSFLNKRKIRLIGVRVKK